jgi:hypothetical protein
MGEDVGEQHVDEVLSWSLQYMGEGRDENRVETSDSRLNSVPSDQQRGAREAARHTQRRHAVACIQDCDEGGTCGEHADEAAVELLSGNQLSIAVCLFPTI